MDQIKHLLKNSYFNYTNHSGVKFRRIEETLDKEINFDKYGILSRKEFIFYTLQDGYTPAKKENYTYYKRNGELSKPKTLYTIEKDKSYYEITKTEYDYTKYLIDHNFNNLKVAKNFLLQEEERQKKIRLEKEKAEQERREREKQRQTEERERKKRLELRNKKIKKEAEAFINRLGYNPIKKLLDDLVPRYITLDEKENNRTVPASEVEAFYNSIYERLTLILGDLEYSKHLLKRYKETSIKIKIDFRNYILYTEQQLLLSVYAEAMKNKDIHINTFYSIINRIFNDGKIDPESIEKAKNNNNKNNKYTFYQFSPNESNKIEFIESEGEKHFINGFTFYLLENNNNKFKAFEESTGMSFTNKFLSRGNTLQEVKNIFNKHGKEKINKIIEQSISVTGGTPLHNKEFVS